MIGSSALMVLTLATLSLNQPAVAVQASNAVFTTLPNGDLAVEFDVVNEANQAVTAWEVLVNVKLSDSSTRTMTLEREGYSEYAGVKSFPDRFVPPHGSVRGRLVFRSIHNGTVEAVTAQLRWAVFADRSSVGHGKDVEGVFARRNSDYEALTAIAGALRSALASGRGHESLRTALKALNNPGQADFGHSAKRQMRINLQMAIDKHPAVALSSEEFLRLWLSRTEAQLRAADEHRRRPVK